MFSNAAPDCTAAGAGTTRVRMAQVFAGEIQSAPIFLLLPDKIGHGTWQSCGYYDQVIAAPDHHVVNCVRRKRRVFRLDQWQIIVCKGLAACPPSIHF